MIQSGLESLTSNFVLSASEVTVLRITRLRRVEGQKAQSLCDWRGLGSQQFKNREIPSIRIQPYKLSPAMPFTPSSYFLLLFFLFINQLHEAIIYIQRNSNMLRLMAFEKLYIVM